jgi:tubulin--tyrosine ligase like protein 10
MNLLAKELREIVV